MRVTRALGRAVPEWAQEDGSPENYQWLEQVRQEIEAQEHELYRLHQQAKHLLNQLDSHGYYGAHVTVQSGDTFAVYVPCSPESGEQAADLLGSKIIARSDKQSRYGVWIQVTVPHQ